MYVDEKSSIHRDVYRDHQNTVVLWLPLVTVVSDSNTPLGCRLATSLHSNRDCSCEGSDLAQKKKKRNLTSHFESEDFMLFRHVVVSSTLYTASSPWSNVGSFPIATPPLSSKQLSMLTDPFFEVHQRHELSPAHQRTRPSFERQPCSRTPSPSECLIQSTIVSRPRTRIIDRMPSLAYGPLP